MKRIISLLVFTVMILLTFSSCTANNTSSAENSSADDSSSTVDVSSGNISSKTEYLSDSDLAKTVAEKLYVPDNSNITYTVSESFYWEAADCYYKNIEFFEKNIFVAAASVDPFTGKLLRNVYKYVDYGISNNASASSAEINFYSFFEDKNFARTVAHSMSKSPHEAITEEELADLSGGIMVYGDVVSLAGIGYLKSITELDVFKCDVTEIPSEITECKNLKRLNLLKAYSLQKLPENIGDLKNLEFLRISLTEVKELPKSIGDLKNLKYLYSDNCCVTTVPESIGDCEKLVVLDLHSTKIIEIPDSVTKLENLKSLDLSYTKIAGLPENIGALSELVRLDLFGLDIKQLPQSLKNLKKIEYLNVYNNYNLNEDYKQWFDNECYKCTNDPIDNENWDDGLN